MDMKNGTRIDNETRELTIDQLDIVSGGSDITDLAHNCAVAAINAQNMQNRPIKTSDLK
jgi:hypothetical protein